MKSLIVCADSVPPSECYSARTEKFTAAVTAGTAAALAHPLVAEAALTPSLKNTLLSVVAGRGPVANPCSFFGALPRVTHRGCWIEFTRISRRC